MMGYEYVIGFPRARDALAAWCKVTGKKIKIPTNCCEALLPFASELVPIDPETGLAPVPVQLYGYRQEFPSAELEIDPLLTGLFGKPFATSVVVSFGYAKTIDIGGGGGLMTNDANLYRELRPLEQWPPILSEPLAHAINSIHARIMEGKRQYEEIEKQLAAHVDRLPGRPVIPWRFVAKNPTKEARNRIDYFGYRTSKNYPPLPGVTDAGAIEWGNKVINIWQ